MRVEIQGECVRGLKLLEDFLAHEVHRGPVLGYAVAVVADGDTLAHLWCGHADGARTRAWEEDTLVCLFSASKPLAAACVLKLIERGQIALDEPLASYWPEFARNGKEQATVRHALAHLAGVPIAESAPPRAVYDPPALVHAIEDQAPLWAPGSQLCFHSFTYGILAGELVRRVDGRSLPQFFREEIADPLALDLHIALDGEAQRRCAEHVLPEDNSLFRMMTDPTTILGRSWRPMPWAELNSAAFRSCGFPSIGAHGSAIGVARFYAAMACGGALGRRRMLDQAVVREALSEQHHGADAFMGAPVRMGLGFMLHNHAFGFTGSAGSFGQPGLGGVAGVGDADARIGVGVTCNLLNGAIENPLLERVLQIVAEHG